MSKDYFPYGVYDTKKCGLVYIGLCIDENECWEVFLGWPSEEEIQWNKDQGLRVIPLTVSYDPKRL